MIQKIKGKECAFQRKNESEHITYVLEQFDLLMNDDRVEEDR